MTGTLIRSGFSDPNGTGIKPPHRPRCRHSGIDKTLERLDDLHSIDPLRLRRNVSGINNASFSLGRFTERVA